MERGLARKPRASFRPQASAARRWEPGCTTFKLGAYCPWQISVSSLLKSLSPQPIGMVATPSRGAQALNPCHYWLLRPPIRRQEYLTRITICSSVSLSTFQNAPAQRPIRGNTFEATISPVHLPLSNSFQLPQSHRNFPYIFKY
ncbi:hypothetical protein BJY00DRAFT_194690 [Aspergillus carlsbadensis]|nr:hypothetical protein BJY00DRAFT_194690 [Aspergillus carlsbadensis]